MYLALEVVHAVDKEFSEKNLEENHKEAVKTAKSAVQGNSTLQNVFLELNDFLMA